jgi:hypothetical protein
MVRDTAFGYVCMNGEEFSVLVFNLDEEISVLKVRF